MAIGRREGGGKREDREMQQLESWIGCFRFRVKRAKLWGRRELASPRLDRKEKVEMRAVVSHGRDFFPPRLNIVGRPHPVLIVTRSESQLHSPPPAAFSRVNSVSGKEKWKKLSTRECARLVKVLRAPRLEKTIDTSASVVGPTFFESSIVGSVKKGVGGAVIRESERALSVNRVTGNCARIIVVNRGNELFANAEGLVFWEMNSLA